MLKKSAKILLYHFVSQVYIPNYNKPNPAAITKPGGVNGDSANGPGRNCESCHAASSSQWYSWGPSHMNCRLCSNCWNYWKKHGGLKMPTRIDGDRSVPTPRAGSTDGSSEGTPDRVGRDPTTTSNTPIKLTENASTHLQPHRPNRCSVADCGKEFKLKAHLERHCATAHGMAMGAGVAVAGGVGGGGVVGGSVTGGGVGVLSVVPGSPSPSMNGQSVVGGGGGPGSGVSKTKVAFSLVTTPLCKVARRVAKESYRPHRAACHPFVPLDTAAIVQVFWLLREGGGGGDGGSGSE